jgi:transposase
MFSAEWRFFGSKAKVFHTNKLLILLEFATIPLPSILILYKHGGLDEIRKENYYRPESELLKHSESLEKYFREHPVSSISEAITIIEKLTGIQRKKSQVRVFLRKLGMRPRKVGSVPSGADPIAQEEFLKKTLEPRIEEAKAGKRKVLFMDAAHFVFAPFLGYLWCFTRLFVKAPCGRKRFNVLGALDAITHEMTVFTNTGYINALCVCDLLTKIAKKYCKLPVSIVLDNARYQKCNLVQEFAKSLNIELLYLPSYSPNLNLIERIWKFIKKKCLYSKYYPDFDSFTQSISNCINKTNEEYKKELDSFLTLKFQTFSKSQIITG